jgi:hypothetical protein
MGTSASPGGSVRMDYRCAACGYGAVAIDVPPACPMCGGSTWDHAEWRPFSATGAEPLAEPAAPVGAGRAPSA